MLKLYVYNNEDSTRFVIGSKYESYEMCSDEILTGILHSFGDERETTKILQELGAITEYYDFREDKETTKEEYENHLIDYNPDKSYIVPISYFTRKIDAEKCIKYLEEINK